MKPFFNLIAFTLGCLLVSACSIFDDGISDDINIDEVELSASQIIEVSKATKLINILALQEVLKNDNFASHHFHNNEETRTRSNECPLISPDPAEYDPLVRTNYTLEFDQCALSDQLIGVSGTPIVIGKINISLLGALGHSGCEFRVFGEDLSIGAVKYLNYDITQSHKRQITSDTCFKRDIIDFVTFIDALEFSVTGVSDIGETDDIIKVFSSSNARTRYRDYGCDTDINEFITILDDQIVIQADTIVSGYVEDGEEFSRNTFTDVAAEFDLICPCPISQSFNIVRGGVTSLTCFDFDDEVCDDDLTCLTTTIPLDCRF